MSESNKLKAIIVDDEELARTVVKEYLQKHSDIEIAAECANGLEAVKQITELNPDLIFLDIQMPKLTGFDVLELTGRKSGVIFVTAFDEFAIKAFEVHAMDYLLKPFTQERFDEALAHAREQVGADFPAMGEVISQTSKKPLERILIREGSKVHVIPIEKIDFIQAQDDYIEIKSEGKSYLKQQRLTDLENQLNPHQFVRVHRSYILNLEKLNRMELYAKDSRIALLKDGAQIPISRSGYDRIRKFL